MTPEVFRKIYPLMAGWIDNTLSSHVEKARSVASTGFKRLPLYYSSALLARAKFVPVDRCPTPPLASMGVELFRDFEEMNPAGITYLDTYFVHQRHVTSERLHFHELIHVVQWFVLGPEKFLATYADGLERYGYRDSPLEVMAYDAEAAFALGGQPFDAEKLVREQLGRIAG
ncbi:MAG TPA: hypothetical protein VGM64_09580 [Lacunisphaera sp.]|jgi:hypothetical protein